MDSALKKRLIGAVVLVIFAVIFLPMVFDGTSSTSEQAVDLTIPPAPGREFETRVLPLQPQSPAAAIGGDPTEPATPIADPDAIVTVDADDAKPADAMQGTPMARQDPPIDTGAYQPGASQADGSTSSASATGTPVASPVPNGGGAATLPAATPSAAAPPAPPSSSAGAPSTGAPPVAARGRYVVSFGSYTRKDNADALVAALRKGGVPAYAEEVAVNGQAALRVRAGPFVDRAAADETRLVAKRVRADAPGTVVEVDNSAAAAAAASAPPPASAAAGAARPASPTGWAVQVAALKSEAEATAQRDKLRGAGFAAFVDPVRTEDGTLYRVRVGPEAVRAGAEKLRDALKQQFALDGMVVTHP